MKKSVSIFVLLLILSLSLSPFLVTHAKTWWGKVYLLGYGYSVIQTKDGGYAIAGKGDGQFLLLKTNLYGTVEWNKTYGSGWASSIVQTSDGGYALAGPRALFSFVKTDSAGNMEWNKTYGKPSATFKAKSLIQTSDGGYALAGDLQSSGSGCDVWLVKTNGEGNMQWSKTYGGAFYACSIVETDDGGYAIAGSTNSSSVGGEDFCLIKTDSEGNAQWNQTYGGPNRDQTYSLVKTVDGGYLLAGDTKSFDTFCSDGWLVKTDSQGNKEWDKTYGETYGGRGWNSFCSAVQTHDGGYIASGRVEQGGQGGYNSPAWVVKTDASGNVEWDFRYRPDDTMNAWANDIIETNDGGYVFTGSKTLQDDPHIAPEYIVLVKIGGNGDIRSPTVSIVSPENKTFTVNNVSLNFTISEPTSWIGYSLDGQRNVTITENITLTELSHGSHNLTVYARDTAGNTGTSETIYFSIAQQSEPQKSAPFPTTWIATAIVITVVVGAALLVYFRKIRKTTGEGEKVTPEGVM